MEAWNRRWVALLAVLAGMTCACAPVWASCPTGVKPTQSTSLGPVSQQSNCKLGMSRGFPLPDADCTPGAINPTVTLAVLQSGDFKTTCDRNTATSAVAKQATYGAYSVKKPTKNTGQNQTCELDHLVSLELGGADTLDNIWPQCGPPGTTLPNRYFKIKDGVENYLAVMVRNGSIELKDAQQKIASDWTQFIDAAQNYWSTHKASGFGLDE